MSGARAWVTLATNDSYSLGALVLAHSLRRVGSAYPAAIMVTPGVTDVMRERLRTAFAEVLLVDVLDSADAAHLALLARPELGITFTKLHCWTLTQYEKCVFLDADTLVLQNSDELFEREELSAAPDIGWPDCFNSGVFVYRPSLETFQALLEHARSRGSFDGGDQGLLNTFFSTWAHGDISKHLPFLYNVCSTSFYSYLPALKQFGENMKIVHFIGNAKPWLQNFNWETRAVSGESHLQPTLQLWWDIFCSHVHANLDSTMAGIAGTFSQITLGVEGQQAAIDESMRRQGWEAGNIDYMGADSFANIWAKISQTLGLTPDSAPETKQPSPPKEIIETKQPSPPKELVEAKEPSPPKEIIQEKQPSPPKEATPEAKQPSPPKEITPVQTSIPLPAPAEQLSLKEPSPSEELTTLSSTDKEILPEKESPFTAEITPSGNVVEPEHPKQPSPPKEDKPVEVLPESIVKAVPSEVLQESKKVDEGTAETATSPIEGIGKVQITGEQTTSPSESSVTSVPKPDDSATAVTKEEVASKKPEEKEPLVCPISKPGECKKPEPKSQEEGEEETRL